MLRYVLIAIGIVGLIARPTPAEADIYSYTDSEGVVHFTNTAPRKKRSQWKRLSQAESSIGKSAARRGLCKRCDSVPARDRDSNRFARYDTHIYEASLLYQIPVPLIRAVIKVESDYDPRVVSSAGARGLMQLMPGTAKSMGVRHVHDPRENILGGTRYLRVLANRFTGNLSLTIAGYHAGPGAIRKYKNTVPPYANTRKYLGMVLKQYGHYKKLAIAAK